MAVVEIGRDIYPMFSIKRRTTYLIEYMLKKIMPQQSMSPSTVEHMDDFYLHFMISQIICLISMFCN